MLPTEDNAETMRKYTSYNRLILIFFYRFILSAGCLLFGAIPMSLSAQVTVSNMFTSGMVLQQNTDINIWGWANQGENISVTSSWNNLTVTTVTDLNKKWMLKLHTPAAKTDGTAYTITIKGTNTIVLNNILVGEVWLLSGQSNMEMPLEGWDGATVENSTQSIAGANYPNIRLMIVGKKSSAVPLVNIERNWVDGSWTTCTPASARVFSALGYFFGKELNTELKIPIGLVQSAWGGSSCETWANVASLNQVSDYKNKGPWIPTGTDDNQTANVLYNGMIAPIVPFTFAGVLWYQGETNVGRAQQLTELFPAMIDGWRNDFQKSDLPFYFVQLCSYNYGGSLPDLREAQSYALLMKNTGMVGTLDVGDYTNIHPAKKEPVGHRMALLALARNYGNSELVYSGPQYKSMATEGSKIRVSFNYAESGLKATDNSPAQFEVAGSDLVFMPAKTLIDKSTLLIWNDNITEPKHVRYAWTDAAVATLFNNDGLPATPFRSNTPTYMLPIKASLKVDLSPIKLGETCQLDWTTFGATEVSLNGNILSSNGSMLLKPEKTTDYTFIARGNNATITRNFTVYVYSGVKSAYPDGIPHPIPGSFSSAYFDEGGEGISYHDLTKLNDGNGIRKEYGVDTDTRLPEGNVSLIATGEWLEYTVKVAEDANYTFSILFATAGRYGKFHIGFDGVDKTGLIGVLSTGSYNNFSAKTITGIALKKGVQVMRIFFDYAEYNLGTITVSKEITSGIEESGNKNKLILFPSPTRDKLFISGVETGQSYSIINLYGQVLQTGIIPENRTFDVKALLSGNYFISIKDNKGLQTEKFIKL